MTYESPAVLAGHLLGADKLVFAHHEFAARVLAPWSPGTPGRIACHRINFVKSTTYEPDWYLLVT
jgi:hypothetical protein